MEHEPFGVRHAGKLCIFFICLAVVVFSFSGWRFYSAYTLHEARYSIGAPMKADFLEAYSYPNGFLEPDYSKPVPENPMMIHIKPCSTKVPRREDSELVQVPAGWVRDVSRRINKLEAK